MVRQKARVDQNQPEIVEALEKAGVSVAHLHQLGHGVPDILVGSPGITLVGYVSSDLANLLSLVGKRTGDFIVLYGTNILMEIKMPGKKLTPDEEKWHNGWKGRVAIVESVEDALGLVGKLADGD